MNWYLRGFCLTDDPAKLQHAVVVDMLREGTYWANDIPPERLTEAFEHSLCFSLLLGERQVGFARWVTDRSVFGYLEDVFVANDCRGQGLASWMVGKMFEHPDIRRLRKAMLATADAHGLYTRFGFSSPGKPDWIMERYNPDAYVGT